MNQYTEMSFENRLKGSALLSALLVVGFIAVILGSLSWSQHISIKQTQQLFNADQAYQYALGVEDWAKGYLIKQKINEKILIADNFPIQFNKTIPGGTVEGQITDLQAKFNINNANQLEDFANFKHMVMEINDIDHDHLKELLNALRPEGSTYGQQTVNVADISELRTFPGVTADVYQKLMPYWVALPQQTLINVNTASAIVLLAA